MSVNKLGPSPLAMTIPFTKMQGLGNDFVIVEEDRLPVSEPISSVATQLCNRHFGVGADGLIIVSASDDEQTDIKFRFYNPDGSESEMCGNGIRCFARYVKDQGIISRNTFKVDTLAGVIIPKINADNTVTVDMGLPRLKAEQLGFTGSSAEPIIDYPLTLESGSKVPLTLVSMGNPHAIVFADKAPKGFDITLHGPEIETNPLFANRTNVEWVEIQDENNISVTVWERGAGLTLACGTGACASAVACILHHKTSHHVNVALPGGVLLIEWDGENSVMMTGPATYVFQGNTTLGQPVFSA